MKKIHSNRFVNRFPGLIFILFLGSTIVACAPEEDGVAKGPKFLFFADNGPQGREPWVSDGTVVNTKGIKDLALNSISSVKGTGLMGSTKIAYLNNKAYFAANDGSSAGEELWVSNGWPAGTGRVADINETLSINSAPRYLTEFKNALYFSANDGVNGQELWRTDGTTTSLVVNLDGTASSDPTHLTVVGEYLYFSAKTVANGRELYRTNGDLNNSELININITPASADSNPQHMAMLNDKLYFSATDGGAEGHELWCYGCGTVPTGPVMIKNINAGLSDSYPKYLTAFNGNLYFSADDTTNGRELWVSNGAVGNAERVDLSNLVGLKNPTSLIEFKSALYFGGSDTTGTDLWKYTGTGIPVKVQVIESVGANTTVADMLEFKGQLYFAADNVANGLELWVSDGATASLFYDINQNGTDSALTVVE